MLRISKRVKLSAWQDTGVAAANTGPAFFFMQPVRCVIPLGGIPPAGRLPIKGAATEKRSYARLDAALRVHRDASSNEKRP